MMRSLVGWHRLWPDSLFAQLGVIVVAGGLSIQLLFSSIWYDVRYSQVLEVPARLVAFRTVDTLQHLESEEAVALLSSATFHPELLSSPLSTPVQLDNAQKNVERMLRDAIRQEVGEAVQLSLLDVIGPGRHRAHCGANQHSPLEAPDARCLGTGAGY